MYHLYLEGRYEVVVTNGRKIVYRAFFEDYDHSQEVLDAALDEYGHKFHVEYFDHTPFAKQRA